MMTTNEQLNFIQFVESAMGELMLSHGYSRERATKAMLQVITRSIAPSTVVLTDEQVFEVMQYYNLGMEQAARALTVSKSLEHIMSEKGVSCKVAVTQLTQYLRRAKLASDPYDSSSDESDAAASYDHPVQLALPEQKPHTASTLPSSSERRKLFSGPKVPLSSRKNKVSSSTLSNNCKISSIEHPKRERPDSAADEVVAKLKSDGNSSNKISGIAKSFDSGSSVVVGGTIGGNNKSVLSTPSVGRAKRSRGIGGDDSDNDLISGSNSKRSRA